MKFSQLTMLIVAGVAVAGTLIAQPANANVAGDAATRYAASIYAQQQGLPPNYYDMQQAAQKGYGYGGYNPNNYGNYAPYGGGYGYPSGGVPYGGW